MDVLEANVYMTVHKGDAPLVGFFVQKRRQDGLWSNMSLTWTAIEQAQQHAREIGNSDGSNVRVCRCDHTPMPASAEVICAAPPIQLRDVLAGQALAGLCAQVAMNDLSSEDRAAMAYKDADAMIRERKN